jgi:hypothetical protein
MAVRTFAGVTIRQLADIVASLPTCDTIKDICLQVGTSDILNDTHGSNLDTLLTDYHQLLLTIWKTFPKCHISVCSLLPIPSSHRIEQLIASFSSHLFDLCDQYRFARFRDLIPPMLTHTKCPNMQYFDKSDTLLNQNGGFMVRDLLLSEVVRWKNRSYSSKHA